MNSIRTGALISCLRREHGLTQRELAGLLGVSDKAVSKWERGECFPDITLIPPLAAHLGISADELLAGEREEGAAPQAEEPQLTRHADARIAPLLLSGAQERLRRYTLGALAVLALGFVLRYLLTPATNTLSASAPYPYLVPGLGMLCALGAAALWLLAASRYGESLRQYSSLTKAGGQDGSRTAGTTVALGVAALAVSLCLELWAGSGTVNANHSPAVLWRGNLDMAIPLVCALAAANLLLRWQGDRRQEEVGRTETAVLCLSLALGLLCALGSVWLVLRAVGAGAYPLPDIPQQVLERVDFRASITELLDFYRLYFSYTVPALRPGISGALPLLLGTGGAALAVNVLWLARRRSRRTAVCALANLAMAALIALGPALWLRLAPLATLIQGGAEETGGQILLLLTPAWFDVTLVAALTLRHLAGVLTARGGACAQAEA